MKNYLIEFTNRTTAKNSLQKKIVEIMQSKHRSVVRESILSPFIQSVEAEIVAAHNESPRCTAMQISHTENEGDVYFEVSAPCESTFCRMVFMEFEG